MKVSNIIRWGLATTAICVSFGLTSVAHADNPLDYPPFKWYPLFPESKEVRQGQSNSDKSNGGPQTNIMQNKNKSKQWYEGDFMGMDDD